MTARNLIETAFNRIPDVYDGFTLAADEVCRIALKGERQHRRGRPAPRGFSAVLAAKYFTVKWLAQYASGVNALPTIADVHKMRPDAILAASYAADYPEFKPWADALPAEFWEIDYATLMGAQ